MTHRAQICDGYTRNQSRLLGLIASRERTPCLITTGNSQTFAFISPTLGEGAVNPANNLDQRDLIRLLDRKDLTQGPPIKTHFAFFCSEDPQDYPARDETRDVLTSYRIIMPVI